MNFQVNSAILDACVLAILSIEDAYGYKLTQDIKEKLDVSESTLYPVLRRLQKEELLETYDIAVTGRNRRYYRLTAKGKLKYIEYQIDWKEFSIKIGGILQGGKKHE